MCYKREIYCTYISILKRLTLNWILDIQKNKPMSVNLAPAIERQDRNPRPPTREQEQQISNLTETKDQIVHATKLALTKILTQPRH
jgi:hypothetical protein